MHACSVGFFKSTTWRWHPAHCTIPSLDFCDRDVSEHCRWNFWAVRHFILVSLRDFFAFFVFPTCSLLYILGRLRSDLVNIVWKKKVVFSYFSLVQAHFWEIIRELVSVAPCGILYYNPCTLSTFCSTWTTPLPVSYSFSHSSATLYRSFVISVFLVMVGCVDIAFVDSCFHEIISSFIYHIEEMQSIIDFW